MSNKTMAQFLVREVQHEAKATRVMLSRVPEEHLEWRPHPKSSTLGTLAWHIATIPGAAARLLDLGGFDMGAARPRSLPEGKTDFVAELDRNLEKVVAILEPLDDAAAFGAFPISRNGELVRNAPKLLFIRTLLLNHQIHHRGQLSVYLRLLDVPVPATYGTSADETQDL